MRDAVLRDERAHRRAERPAKKVHGIVGVQAVGRRDPLRGQRLMVVPSDVAGELIGSGQRRLGVSRFSTLRYGPRESQQPSLYLQPHGPLTSRIALPEFVLPLLKLQFIAGGAGRIDHQLALQHSIHHAQLQPGGQEAAQRYCHNEVRLLAVEVYDLMRDRRPENRQSPGRDGSAASAEQVCQRARSEEVDLDLVVPVRSGHARRRPQLAGETVGRELRPCVVETFQADIRIP